MHPIDIRTGPHLRVGSEGGSEETVGFKFGLRASLHPRLIPDAPDAGSRLLYEVDVVEQIGDQRVAPNASAAKIGKRQSPWQPAWTHYLDAVGVNLDKNVGSVNEPITMHNGVRDGLPQGVGGILGDIASPQAFDAVRGTSIALHEAQGILDIGHDAAVEILAIQDVHLVGASCEQTGDVGLWKKAARILGEEEHSGVPEEQRTVRSFSRSDVDQHVLGPRLAGNARKTEPGVEFSAIKIVWIVEPGTGCEIKSDSSFKTKHVSDFVSVQFLGYRSLTQEEAIAALHRLGGTFSYVDRNHGANRFRVYLYRWITIAGDVLDAGA